MNPSSCVQYYLQHRHEFYGEDGHEVLLSKLKQLLSSHPSFSVSSSTSMSVAIDVGSCVGDYIPHLQDLFHNVSQTMIVCIEPNPANLQELVPKINTNPQIKLFPCCVSNVNTMANFHNLVGAISNTPNNATGGLRSGGDTICHVEVRTLESILNQMLSIQERQDMVITLIKIDTEGNDTNVIKGIGQYLSQTKYIIFECSDCLDDRRGPGIPNPMKDIVDFLFNHGFATYRIGTRKLLPVYGSYWNDTYEQVKFWSNCFALKYNDPIIHDIIDDTFSYR